MIFDRSQRLTLTVIRENAILINLDTGRGECAIEASACVLTLIQARCLNGLLKERLSVSFLESGLTFVSTVKPDSRKDTRREPSMIGVFVTFRYADNFDEQAVRKIAETTRARFEGMPGLRSKAFTINSGKREATNFYVWDSEDAAKAFFTDALLERITGLYGVRPSVEFVQIATLVENARA